MSAGELKKVYKDIGSSVGFVKVFRDITTWFVGIALAPAVVSCALSLAWFSRLP